jgi:hypothetical protein
MTRNAAEADNVEQKEDASWTHNLMHLHFKSLCAAGLLPYEEICNTPRKIKLYRIYQVGIYVLYIPLLLSQILKLYHMSGNLFVVIETVTHISMGAAAYLSPLFVNWNDAYKLMLKLQTAIASKLATQNNGKKMEVLRETKRRAEYLASVALILGQATVVCDLCEVFILYFVEYLVGIEHKHKMIPNISTIYITLLLQKYPFSSWVPYDETSIPAHLVTYLYATFPVLELAFRVGIMTSLLMGICMYSALQFKFVSMSLENLNNMEESVCEIQNKALNNQHEQDTAEELNYRISQVKTEFDESDPITGRENAPQLRNQKVHSEGSTDRVDFVKDKQHCRADNKLTPEDSLADIIRDHQEAIWYVLSNLTCTIFTVPFITTFNFITLIPISPRRTYNFNKGKR